MESALETKIGNINKEISIRLIECQALPLKVDTQLPKPNQNIKFPLKKKVLPGYSKSYKNKT